MPVANKSSSQHVFDSSRENCVRAHRYGNNVAPALCNPSTPRNAHRDTSGHVDVSIFPLECKISKKNLLLTYVWGTMSQNDDNGAMLRSAVESYRRVATTPTDVVVMSHSFVANETWTSWAAANGVKFVSVPQSIMQRSLAFKRSMAENYFVTFRFVAYEYFLDDPSVLKKYQNVAVMDADVLFQQDPFGSSCLGSLSPALHVFQENEAVMLHEDKLHKEWIQGCPEIGGVKGDDIWKKVESFGRICAGYTQGDTKSMLSYIRNMGIEVDKPSLCNDQGIHNALIWTKALLSPDVPRIFVWNTFHGPLKTLDVGFYRDSYGMAYTDHGSPYCVLHQYNKNRSPDFVDQWSKILSTRHGQELPQALRFPAWNGTIALSGNSAVSLGVTGGAANISRNDVQSFFYTPMQDTRFATGVHFAVGIMQRKGAAIPPMMCDGRNEFGAFHNVWMPGFRKMRPRKNFPEPIRKSCTRWGYSALFEKPN